MEDYPFTNSDLTDGKLIVSEAVVGGFSIEDNEGKLIMPSQKRITGGVEVELSAFTVSGSWRVRFFRGKPGENTTGGISSQDAMIYALTFG